MVGLGVTLSIQGTHVGRYWKLSARDDHVARGVRELGSHERMSPVSLRVSSFLELSREELGVERLSFTELDLHSRARRE